MKLQNTDKISKTSEGKLTKGINIPPQSSIPKMPPVQPPKKAKQS